VSQIGIKPEYVFDKPEGEKWLQAITQAVINGDTVIVNDHVCYVEPALDNLIERNT